MYGPVISALFLGLVPLWGVHAPQVAAPQLTVSSPARTPSSLAASVLAGEPQIQGGSLSASGVLVLDADSGQKIFGRDIDVQRPMASLTKQMTALLIMEKHGHELDRLVRVPADIASVEGNVVNLRPGDEYTVGDLLTAMLVASANDAAVTLAQFDSGSVPAFVEEMNRRAAELGLRDTVFRNPVGLDAVGQRSTPQDLGWLALFVMRTPQIRDRMSMRSAEIRGKSGDLIALSHTYALMHTSPDILAGKTGTTDDAGQCLVSLVEEAGRRYIIVLLQSGDRYRDMRVLLNALRA